MFGWFARVVFVAVVIVFAYPVFADDLKIRSPIVEPHELEQENNLVFGSGQNFVHELEYGFTDWLKLGVESELAADPGHGLHYDATSLEGFLQLTPQGQYWADVGLFAEYEHTARVNHGDPHNLLFGPLVEKESKLFGLDMLHSLNVLFNKDVGQGASGVWRMEVAAQSRWRLNPHLEPTIEYYGNWPLGHGDLPEHRLGPGFAGKVSLRELGITTPTPIDIRYDAAYLRGLNGNTDRNTGRVRVEFEFAF